MRGVPLVGYNGAKSDFRNDRVKRVRGFGREGCTPLSQWFLFTGLVKGDLTRRYSPNSPDRTDVGNFTTGCHRDATLRILGHGAHEGVNSSELSQYVDIDDLALGLEKTYKNGPTKIFYFTSKYSPGDVSSYISPGNSFSKVPGIVFQDFDVPELLAVVRLRLPESTQRVHGLWSRWFPALSLL